MLNKVTPGDNAPHEINVIIEIPAHSEAVKYEVDKDTGVMFVDRFMSTSMRYPCDYGYIPRTLSQDGDPVDVVVISPLPLITGSVITARPIGVLNMTDEAGIDKKILAVPLTRLSAIYEHAKCPEDIGTHQLEVIEHFFQHYKDLEKGKWVKIDGWEGIDAAIAEIEDAMKRYQG